jgi:hypothetical protein
MAKPEEEQRDGLFDMSLGDGMIEIDETPAAEKPAEEKPKVEKKPEVGEPSIYEDGTFEINDTPSEETEAASAAENNEFFDNTENEEKPKKTPSKDESSSDSSSSSPYLAFARDRANEGVFLEFTDEDWATLKERNEDDEAAALRELSQISMREQIRAGVENYKESVTDEDRALYEAKDKGLPVDEYSVAKRNFDKYSKIKEDDLAEDQALQIDLVSKALAMRGYSKEEIDEEIDGYKALENLESKAKKALKGLPAAYKGTIDNLEKGATDAENARQDGIRQRVARMKRNIENTPEIIPGIKLTKPTREKIMKSMTVPIAKGENGEPLNPVMATRVKNPDAFEMMVHYYHSLGLFNIDDDGQMKPDFSKIAKVQKTKATDEMRNIFETTEKPVAGKAKVPHQTEDELDDFEKAFRRL